MCDDKTQIRFLTFAKLQFSISFNVSLPAISNKGQCTHKTNIFWVKNVRGAQASHVE